MEVTETSGSRYVALSDLDLTEEEWSTKTQEEKEEILNKYCDDLPEQPYWMVSSFEEE